jgi:3-deoxy-7-phosphoheptulonate synthase
VIIQLKHTAPFEITSQILFELTQSNILHRYVQPQQVIVIIKPSSLTQQIIDKYHQYIHHTALTDSAYPLASKAFRESTIVDVDGVKVGEGYLTMMAGPCSVESEKQINTTADFLASKGVKILRGGAYKPRTSPYSFRGHGKQALQWMRKAADRNGMKVVTEILDLSLLDEVMQYADMLQVGSRNMQNFYMLAELGKVNKPVLLKRGMHAKSKEWLLAAEYILSGGNDQVILCERGIRSFDPDTRNVLDLGIIPLIKELSHLPIIADPSHGTGIASRVLPMSLASIAAGAHGLLIEVHPKPDEALSDKQQAINFETFDMLTQKISLYNDALLETSGSY